MNTVNTELSLEQTLRILKDERADLLSNNLSNIEKMLNKIDDLIERTESLMEDELFEDKILIGSLVDLTINLENGVRQNTSLYLGFDLNYVTINILSPLGSAIYGASSGDVVTYEVAGNKLDAVINGKNIMEENLPENVTLCNSSADVVIKKKMINN